MKPKIILLSLTILAIVSSVCFAEDGLSIKDYLEGALPAQPSRKIVVNEATGLLTITDTRPNHKLIKKLIEQIDIGPRQIMIETKFVEVTVNDLDELGVEWYWHRAGSTKGGNFSNLAAGTSPDYSNDNVITSADGVSWYHTSADEDDSSFPRTSQGLDLFVSKTTYKGSYLRAFLHALESEGRANMLSAPKVTTLSGQMANMQMTRTFPYVSEVKLENIGTSEDPTWVFEYILDERTVGISLEVTPFVGEGSNYITMDIHPVVDVLVAQRSIRPTFNGVYEYTYYQYDQTGEITNQYTNRIETEIPGVPVGVGWPEVESRSTQTSLIVGSGETVILGGLIKDEERVTEKKVPILGSIPILGHLFRYKHVDREKKNLLIFITATLVDTEGKVIY